MRINNEVIWQQAENLAKSINEAYKNKEKIDATRGAGEKLESAIESITMNVTKVRFVGICKVVADYMPTMSDYFTMAVATAVNLPMERNSEDKEVTFEMFIICLRFHIAIYKRKWGK
mgnify:CR=1 FL=1